MLKHFTFIGLLFFTSVENSSYYYDLLENSTISITGSTNVNHFVCSNTYIEKQDKDQPFSFAKTKVGYDLEGVKLLISSEDFRCKIPGMAKDMKELLQADNFPFVGFEINHIQLPGGKYGTASATLTIAGVESIGLIDFEVEKVGNQLKIHGSTPLFLSSFNIEPPTKMLGMIKVQDQIEIEFDIIATYYKHYFY